MEPSCVLLAVNLVLILFLVIAFIGLGFLYHKNDSGKTAAGEILKERLKSMLTIKSIVTLILTEVFAYLAIRGEIFTEFLTVYTVIISFYFGTQTQKNQDATKSVKEKTPETPVEQTQE